MSLGLLSSFLANNWGSLASIIGLGVSIWTLIVAKGAKKAAQDAIRESRRQKLTEELQNAVYRVEQLGHHILLKKWEIAYIRAQEISSACSLVLRRWTDTLNEPSKDRILLAQSLAASIAKAAMKASGTEPSEQQMQRIVASQLRAFQLLSAEKGESLGVIERKD
jgi:hypothetical protein